MSSSHRTVAFFVSLLMIVAAAPAAGAPAGDGAVLSSGVRSFLDSADADATMDVIVTFHDGGGLDRLALLGRLMESLESAPIAFVTLDAAQIRDVAAWAETRSVWHNEALELHLDEGTRMVNADDVWAGNGLRKPYTGAGVGVAIVDTGIDATHPDLPYGVKVKRNFYVGGNPLGARPGETVFAESLQTDTEHGHGTHVASTVAGTGAASGGRYAGVAPGADLYGFKVGAGASVLTWWAARAWDWVLTHHEETNVRVVSNSWGGGGGEDYNPDDPIMVLAAALYAEDVVVVFSAGNSGGPDKLNRYATSPHVVSVGAVNKDFTKASFSSVGRPGGDWTRDADGLYRPTVMAPGVDIAAARSSAGAVMSTGVLADNAFYTSASGTSMAAPHVSGIVALMLEARPALSAANVIDVLEGTTADMPDYETWEVGAGMVDALAAVKAAEKGKIKFPPSTKGKTPAYSLGTASEFRGTVAPAGYVLKDASDETIDTIPVEVGAGVDALYAEIEWASNLENVYLFLHDPAGNEVASSAGLLDIGNVNFRSVVVTNPEPGTWTLTVEGRVNLLTDYRGFWGQYDENTLKESKKAPTTATATSTFSGVSGPAVDPVNDWDYHAIEVPESVTSVTVRIDWADATMDLDLWVHDANGRVVGKSTQGGTNWEETTITRGDPMSGELAGGSWTVAVEGWLSVAEGYDGTASVTYIT